MLRRLPWRRLLAPSIAGLGAAALAYGFSWALAAATCENGCPTARAPLLFVVVVGLTAAWSAANGARDRR